MMGEWAPCYFKAARVVMSPADCLRFGGRLMTAEESAAKEEAKRAAERAERKRAHPVLP